MFFRRNPLHCLCVGLDHNENEESERIISSFNETKGLLLSLSHTITSPLSMSLRSYAI